ncbi:MAG: hypothetical protein ABIK37_06710 [candidate division WOR-3 bacterium]
MKKGVLTLAALVAVALCQTHRWAYRYNGVHGQNMNDAADLMVETSNNTILTGTFGKNGTLYGTLLVELSPAGNEASVEFIDSVAPYAMCRGTGGRVFVAGARDAEWDSKGGFSRTDATVVCATVGGGEIWRHNYDHPQSFTYENFSHVAQAPNGNVIALGWCQSVGELTCYLLNGANGAVIDAVYTYAPDSTNLIPAALCTGPSSEYYWAGEYIAGPSNCDFMITRHEASGAVSWFGGYDGHGFDDHVEKMVVSPAGGLIVVGTTNTALNSTSLWVLSLSTTTGNRQWAYEYSYSGMGDQAFDVTFDGAGNIFVTGASIDATTARDFLVLSLTSAGQERWVHRYVGPSGSDDYGYAIDIDNSGNVVAMGNSNNTSYNWDFCAVILSPDGARRGVYRFDDGSNEFMRLRSGFCGADGNVYMGGAGVEAGGSGSQILIESFDPAVGIAEERSAERHGAAQATVARGVLRMGEAEGTLYDVNGGRVRQLRRGDNDIRGLAPGVYLLSAAGTTRRVVVAR